MRRDARRGDAAAGVPRHETRGNAGVGRRLRRRPSAHARTRRGRRCWARERGRGGLVSVRDAQHGDVLAAARERDRTHFARVRLGKRRPNVRRDARGGRRSPRVRTIVRLGNDTDGFSAIASARPAFCAFERAPSGHEHVFLHLTPSRRVGGSGRTNGISTGRITCLRMTLSTALWIRIRIKRIARGRRYFTARGFPERAWHELSCAVRAFHPGLPSACRTRWRPCRTRPSSSRRTRAPRRCWRCATGPRSSTRLRLRGAEPRSHSALELRQSVSSSLMSAL